jgi:hypothetical protein
MVCLHHTLFWVFENALFDVLRLPLVKLFDGRSYSPEDVGGDEGICCFIWWRRVSGIA